MSPYMFPIVLSFLVVLFSILFGAQEYWRREKKRKGLHNLTLGMFCDKNDKACRHHFPKMKLKAAECVSCLPAVLDVWSRTMSAHRQEHVWVQLCLKAACQINDIISQYKESWLLPPLVAARLWECGRQYVVLNTALQKWYETNQGKKMFQSQTFKHHWMLHSLQLAKYINPAHVWCYSGESFMSNCKVLMLACLKGRGQLSSMQMFMGRYACALSRELKTDFCLR